MFTDEHEILGITKPTTHIPEDLKAALAARDGHSRGPGSQLPVDACDVNHVTKRRHGGHTVLSNLAPLARGFHTAVDHAPWEMTLDRDGVCRFDHAPTGRTFTTLSRRMRELRDPGKPSGGTDPP